VLLLKRRWVSNYVSFIILAAQLKPFGLCSSFEWFTQPEDCNAASAFIVAIASKNPRGNVALFEASNEPEVTGGSGVPVSAAFLYSCLIPALRGAAGGVPVSVAMASSNSWSGAYASLLPVVDIIDWHCYNGGGNGAALADEIQDMRALAEGKQLIITEVIARPLSRLPQH